MVAKSKAQTVPASNSQESFKSTKTQRNTPRNYIPFNRLVLYISGVALILAFLAASVFYDLWGCNSLDSQKLGPYCHLQQLIIKFFKSSTSKKATPVEGGYSSKLKIFASGFCVKKDTSKSAHVCGEDAFSLYLSENQPQNGYSFLAVADGVGGWSESGGDSSKISTGILNEMKIQVGKLDKSIVKVNNKSDPKDPKESEKPTDVEETDVLLKTIGIKAFDSMKNRGHKSGSTTVCTCLLDHSKGIMEISNVGDSGALVLRDGSIFKKTKAGVEGFNAPHQLGFDIKGNQYGSYAAMETKILVDLKPGDIVVLMSDGVIDNVYEDELCSFVYKLVGGLVNGDDLKKIADRSKLDKAITERLKTTAQTIAMNAYARAKETLWKSPFAESAISHGYYYMGGKQDDISVIVGVVLDT